MLKRKVILTLSLLLGGIIHSAADNALQPEPLMAEMPDPGDGRIRGLKGYYYTEIDGEETKMLVLNEVTVFPPLKFKNKKQEDFYWRTVRDVKKTLPYAKLIAETLIETYEYLETLPTQKDREAYLKQMEGALFQQYKPILKKFSKRQAKVLVKLVQRETHQSSYDIVKAFLGAFRAGFWQGFGKLFGVSLKSDFRPAKDKNDAMLDRVARLVEQGTI